MVNPSPVASSSNSPPPSSPQPADNPSEPTTPDQSANHPNPDQEYPYHLIEFLHDIPDVDQPHIPDLDPELPHHHQHHHPHAHHQYPNPAALIPRRHVHVCPICLDYVFPAIALTTQPCQHVFCRPCIGTHVSVLAEDSNQYPLPCPECAQPLDDTLCLSLLEDKPESYFKLNRLIIEKGVCDNLRYCANEKCGEPFDWVQDPGVSGRTDEFRVECPICKVATCVECRERWHDGKTCEQHRMDGDGNDNILAMGEQLGWRRCPNCGTLIERREGDCYFVRCRCGCGFCHQCGTAYRSLVPTPGNQHGTPDCDCGLFGQNYPEEEEAERARIAAGLRLLGRRMDQFVARRVPVNAAARALGNGCNGPNGYAGLAEWLVVGRQRRKLSANMLEDLREFRCPYELCNQQFGSLRALEQHLVSVQRHAVWLCCGRPFYSERSRDRHIRAVHGAAAP